MYYGEIKNCDIANGEGVRVSLFVSGCTHHCYNCFNPETWDFKYGKTYTQETEDYIMNLLEPSYINGLSLLGGEPFEPANQKALLPLLKRFREKFGHTKTIWCYSGYKLDDELLKPSRARCDVTDEFLSYIDILVDGEFVQDLKNISLKFRGSSNQRIINVPETLKTGKIVIYMD